MIYSDLGDLLPCLYLIRMKPTLVSAIPTTGAKARPAERMKSASEEAERDHVWPPSKTTKPCRKRPSGLSGTMLRDTLDDLRPHITMRSHPLVGERMRPEPKRRLAWCQRAEHTFIGSSVAQWQQQEV